MTYRKAPIAYRDDIDGLRAIAVSSVIVFHIFANLLPGGFVGVDIFFVISGYLITQRIVIAHETTGFRFGEFYARRIRRLFPALFATLLGTCLVGSIVLTPEDLVNLARSTIATVFSFSNFYFFLESGYWQFGSTRMPLLHTWSLGVEEQFYLVWPLVVITLLRFGNRVSLAALTLLFLASLLFTGLYTGINADATFYLAPFRIYEFAIGAMCVWVDDVDWRRSRLARAGQIGLFVVGFLLIGSSFLYIDKNLSFPGWLALVPAVGAALVILANNPPLLRHILVNPVFRYVGQISYSLYLIHWPILVFLTLQYGYLDRMTILLALAAIFGLASLQYHYIENPLRKRPASSFSGSDTSTATSTFVSACIASLLLTAGALLILKTGGFPGRYDASMQRYATMTLEKENQRRWSGSDAICRNNRRNTICGNIKLESLNILIVGDSHGADGLNIMQSAFPRANYLIAQRPTCSLVSDGVAPSIDPPKCAEYNRRRFEDIESLAGQLDFVVISQQARLDRLESMKAALAWLKERGLISIVLGAGPHFGVFVLPKLLQHNSLEGIDILMQQFQSTRAYQLDELLEPYVKSMGGIYVRKLWFFCPHGLCKIILDNGALLMVDSHHLSLDASQVFGLNISGEYNSILTNKLADY